MATVEFTQAQFENDFSRLRAVAAQKHLKTLDSFGAAMLLKWQDDRAHCVLLVAELGRILTSVDFGKKRQYFLAKVYLRPWLLKPDDLPVIIEAQMVAYWAVAEGCWPLRSTLNSPEKWLKHRTRLAKMWLHAVRRVERALDSHSRPCEPCAGAPLPMRVSGLTMVGFETTAFKKGEVALAAQHQEQREVAVLAKRFLPLARRRLVQLYLQSPDNPAELSELLASYGVSAQFREGIPEFMQVPLF